MKKTVFFSGFRTVSAWAILFFGMAMVFQSCLKEDALGLSNFKEITAFELPGQSGPTEIDSKTKTIKISMPEGADLSALTPSKVVVSNFATLSPSASSVQNFKQEVKYTVTAEDGSSEVWTVIAVPALPQPQLPNSNFDLWHQVGKYQQPGESADKTVWGTANRAVAIAGSANTTPENLGGGDFAAKLVTVKAPLLVRIAAATLFTGKFTTGFPSATDPRSNIDFGTPFGGRPKAFSVEYTYNPGAEYLDGDGKPLPGGDQCDIYVLLEKRTGSSVQRIATGWYRNGDKKTAFTPLNIPLKYGPLKTSDPEYAYANIRTNETWGDPNDTPTHVTVVFSSSALGDTFTGAIGSELRVNNFKLIY